ncbi:hypothetical protein MHO82_24605 [Vibrio sp. Of7-15]|uniref:hypothetical protein n=1 Tax=Vibrio sp. Of7-15 TaxID=2724879 RepID=UPI001EF37B81|nr:hypothetical protein [Vibrio sp. Of7-15]MCG7500049.1 hypothetical protein [Vibrio sp. Of7-15]
MLSNKDLLYVAGAVQPADQTKRHLASHDAGFFGSGFCGPRREPLTPEQVWEFNRVHRDTAFFAKKQTEYAESLPAINAEHLREAAARSDENNRLVQGRKSRTHPKSSQIRHKVGLIRRSVAPKKIIHDSDSILDAHALYELAAFGEGQNTAKVLPPVENTKKIEPNITPSVVRLMHQDWSGKYRVALHTQTPSSAAPEAQAGDRYSEQLTKRSVTKIFESAAYMATCHGGFTTFLTLTFTPQQRAKLFGNQFLGNEDRCPVSFTRNMAEHAPANPELGFDGPYTPLWAKPEKSHTVTKVAETTIGREVSRFMNGAKKMFKRGWLTDHVSKVTDDGQKYSALEVSEIEGTECDFQYIWVAECPANEHGEPNPHVHILLNWTVEPKYFSAWAKRIESLWGNGFAHLERIREPKAAGTYIIKAVGYAAKGDNANQGLIKGNRYGIAQSARAPAWECLASYETSNMAAIIKECGYKLEQWRKPLERKLRQQVAQKEQTVKALAIAKQEKKPQDHIKKLQNRLIRLEHQQRHTRKTMSLRGVFASSRNAFCMAFEGDNAEDKVFDFLLWACGARGWSLVPVISGKADQDHLDDIAEARQTAKHHYKNQYHHHLERRAYWQSVLSDDLIPLDDSDADRRHASSMEDIENYYTQLAA